MELTSYTSTVATHADALFLAQDSGQGAIRDGQKAAQKVVARLRTLEV